MKKPLSVLLYFLMPFLLSAQCNSNLVSLCVQDNGGARVIKEFPVRLKKVKKKDPVPYARFVVPLQKGNQYRMNVKTDTLNQVPATLVLTDDYKTYGNTYDAAKNEYNNSFDFYCRKSGNYYITIIFADHTGGCAVGVISHVDQFNVYSSR